MDCSDNNGKNQRSSKQVDVKNYKRRKGDSIHKSGNRSSSNSSSGCSSASSISSDVDMKHVDTIQCTSPQPLVSIDMLDYNEMKELPAHEAREHFLRNQSQRRQQIEQQVGFIENRMAICDRTKSNSSINNNNDIELSGSIMGFEVASQFFTNKSLTILPGFDLQDCLRQSTSRSDAIQQIANYLAVSVPDLIVPVPPDGLCLSYCFTAARYRKRFMDYRLDCGFRRPDHDGLARLEERDARAFLQRVMVQMRADGRTAMADRLELHGIDGYPGQDELPWFANAASCTVHLYSLESKHAPLPMIIFGSGERVISIGYERSHFVLLNSADDLRRLDGMVSGNNLG